MAHDLFRVSYRIVGWNDVDGDASVTRERESGRVAVNCNGLR